MNCYLFLELALDIIDQNYCSEEIPWTIIPHNNTSSDNPDLSKWLKIVGGSLGYYHRVHCHGIEHFFLNIQSSISPQGNMPSTFIEN